MQKNIVTVYPKHVFSAKLQDIIDGDNLAVISIECTDSCVKYYNENGKEYFNNDHLLEDHEDVLNIDFDDTTEDDERFSVMSLEQAETILNFIIRHIGYDFIIHCNAGKSRSQAVGRFLVDCFPDDFEEDPQNPLRSTYNPEVLRRLKGKYYERFGFGVIRPKTQIKEDAGKLIEVQGVKYYLIGLMKDNNGYKWISLDTINNSLNFIDIAIPYTVIDENKIKITEEMRDNVEETLLIWDIKDGDCDEKLDADLVYMEVGS